MATFALNHRCRDDHDGMISVVDGRDATVLVVGAGNEFALALDETMAGLVGSVEELVGGLE